MYFFNAEELELQKLCRDFAKKELAPFAYQYDEEEKFNIDAFKKLGDLGLLGITANEKYGGVNLGATSATIAMEEFGKIDAGFALSYLAHTILCVNNINNNASDEQKEKYLPDLISGKKIGCMGMSEPENGSDAIGMKTRAKKISDKNYEITGAKMWITNAQFAEVVYLYTRSGDAKKDLTTFIVDAPSPGYSVSKTIHKMGMRTSPTGELSFQKVKVDENQRVGNEGDSMVHMLKNLEIERITISGISLGIAQACVDQCIKYSGERKQFGKNLAHYQMIQKMVAEMATELEMCRRFLYSVTKEYDAGNRSNLLASMVKLQIPKMVTKICLDAIQLHGGYGYSREFPLERYLRDNKLMEIGAGTNEVMIIIIAKNLLDEALKTK